jgi:hypothetical protein
MARCRRSVTPNPMQSNTTAVTLSNSKNVELVGLREPRPVHLTAAEIEPRERQITRRERERE